MRRTARLLLPLAGSALLAACGNDAPPSAPPAAQAPAGARLRLEMAPVADVAELPATITTRDMAEVRARIPGLLASLNVRAGDEVRAGQRIGTITDTRLVQDRAALGAGVAAASAQAERARADLARIRYLAGEGVYAQAKLDEMTAIARAADAQLAAARAQAGAAAALEGQGALLAPAAGRVLSADVPPGSAVAPGMVIATITAGPPIIRLDVPESLAARIVPGAAVSVSGIAGRPADAVLRGRVARVHPGVMAGRVRVDASAPGLDASLVGQRLTAVLVLGERQALSLPATHVSRRFGLSFVSLLAADGRSARDVPVEAQPLPGTDRLEMLSGLKPGDVIVAASAGSAR